MNVPTPVEAINPTLDEIEVPADRLRDTDADKVKELVVSFRERGQLQNIEVLPANAAGQYVLNIGLHRLLAARVLGWERIGAQIFNGTPQEARLREIDENLYRAELNPLDQAVFLAERREEHAEWMLRVAKGKADRLTYTVLDWRAGPKNTLWRPNQVVAVFDPYGGINRDMLIAGVSYKFSDKGTMTTLRMVGVTAYDRINESIRQRGQTKGKGHAAPAKLDSTVTPLTAP